MSKRYSIGEFAKRLGRSPQTIRRWETEGKLQAKRLPSGHRYFDDSDVRSMLGRAPKTRDVVVYCRVSSAGQCEIVVVNQESLSSEQEMVEDLLAIVQTFRCRLYGMRKYKQSLKEDFAHLPLHPPKDLCE